MIGQTQHFARALLAWYDKHRRDLPWRISISASPVRPDPYHVLLSEAMLQQTQVATVIPYFNRFIARFPTLPDLAKADLQEVLRLWQGLGYYSRARNLHACANRIVSEHASQVPRDPQLLLKLEGIGRYTAGAIASIAYDQPAPILDGNVTRVLCRIDQIETDPREKLTQARLWQRAEQILPKKRIGDFNSALMELGATICTPKKPQCHLCPIQKHCQALSAGLVDQIPLPKKSKPTPLFKRDVICIRDGEHFLIEQRSAKGRWAAMWQFKTRERNGRAPTVAQVKSWLGLEVAKIGNLGVIRHALTHRRYEFQAYQAQMIGPRQSGQTWVTLAQLDAYPLSKPQLCIARLLSVGPA